MAGKSTYLRQNALISILAQTGSFVPATYAEIGLVDKIFSRVGSADNLYEDQSTFMVEMLETAQILKEATPRSFVIMDEVGRGTTPEDGVAVGFACLHHLYNVNTSRVLFATHFHALADMTEGKGWEDLSCWCNDVVEDGDGSGRWAYVHKLRKGVNRESHALKVARVAGMPEGAIEVAKGVLEGLKGGKAKVHEQ
jgi:DNA mismatch repair ATPase MutS